MRNKVGLKVLAILFAIVLITSSVAMYGHSGTGVEKGMDEGGGRGVISLMPPPFIGVAGAAVAVSDNNTADKSTNICPACSKRSLPVQSKLMKATTIAPLAVNSEIKEFPNFPFGHKVRKD